MLPLNEKTTFFISFQITKFIQFNVSYQLAQEKSIEHFSTTAVFFSRNKKTFFSSGQCQHNVLKIDPLFQNQVDSIEFNAYQFFQKWDGFHLKKLTNDQFSEMIADLNKLTEVYNYYFNHEIKSYFNNSVTEILKQPLKHKIQNLSFEEHKKLYYIYKKNKL